MNKKMRYIIVMVLGVLMNLGFYEIAHQFHLPVWLDMGGTALAALVLEPAAGLIVGLINNFFLAIQVYSNSSLIYYAVSASVAIIVGNMIKVDGKIEKKRIIPAMVLTILVTTTLSAIITLWRTAGVPDSGWERRFYEMALAASVPSVIATWFGAFVLKVLDTIVCTVLIAAVYICLPKSLKYEKK